nr:UDP-glycosyltransferase 85A5-like [Aegilops tauschii subsp. strangulata]
MGRPANGRCLGDASGESDSTLGTGSASINHGESPLLRRRHCSSSPRTAAPDLDRGEEPLEPELLRLPPLLPLGSAAPHLLAPLRLAASNRPFLWVMWPGLVAGDRGMEALPADFLAETKGWRFIAEWCAQEQVLRHRAVGGFLTHSGWNSTMESIWAGVPMICAPGFTDQYINSRYVCGEWGVGLRLDEQLRREQVAAHIEELMGGGERGEEMRRRAAEWKERRLREAKELGFEGLLPSI